MLGPFDNVCIVEVEVVIVHVGVEGLRGIVLRHYPLPAPSASVMGESAGELPVARALRGGDLMSGSWFAANNCSVRCRSIVMCCWSRSSPLFVDDMPSFRD